MATTKTSKHWSAQAMEPPTITQPEWNLTMLLGLVFIVMAILQIVGFSGFKDALGAMGLQSPATWGVVLIILELWAASAFFKLRLSMAFRMASSLFALLVSGFWFYETVRLVGADLTTNATNVGYFGRYLVQSPGWWTVIEATVVLFWTFWAVSLTRVNRSR